jgi:hypothetical protein
MQTAASGMSPASVWRSEADSGEVLGTHFKKPLADMKVAISSASFAGRLAAGNLTQLEWLEGCASGLGADGIVFERSHFARTDADYLSQLRKVAVDLGLVPLAVDHPGLFAPRSAEVDPHTAIRLAAGLGALFVLTVLPPPTDVPPAAFVAAVAAAKEAVKAAKALNVTLLVSAAPGSLGSDVPALRHFRKDVDSAWLRYMLAAGADRSALGARDRALIVTIDAGADLEGLPEVEESARPWLLLTGDVSVDRVNAVRRAGAKKTLAGAAGVL